MSPFQQNPPFRIVRFPDPLGKTFMSVGEPDYFSPGSWIWFFFFIFVTLFFARFLFIMYTFARFLACGDETQLPNSWPALLKGFQKLIIGIRDACSTADICNGWPALLKGFQKLIRHIDIALSEHSEW